MNIVKENENNHKDKICVFNQILKTDDKLSVMPNTTSRYYELFLSNFTINLYFLQSDIREVAYKLFHNVIFTKEKCKITNDDLCPICSIQSDNIYHMLLECYFHYL